MPVTQTTDVTCTAVAADEAVTPVACGRVQPPSTPSTQPRRSARGRRITGQARCGSRRHRPSAAPPGWLGVLERRHPRVRTGRTVSAHPPARARPGPPLLPRARPVSAGRPRSNPPPLGAQARITPVARRPTDPAGQARAARPEAARAEDSAAGRRIAPVASNPRSNPSPTWAGCPQTPARHAGLGSIRWQVVEQAVRCAPCARAHGAPPECGGRGGGPAHDRPDVDRGRPSDPPLS